MANGCPFVRLVARFKRYEYIGLVTHRRSDAINIMVWWSPDRLPASNTTNIMVWGHIAAQTVQIYGLVAARSVACSRRPGIQGLCAEDECLMGSNRSA